MADARRPATLAELIDRAERFDAFAETAELMGDAATAEQFRARAADYRELAMRRLDP